MRVRRTSGQKDLPKLERQAAKKEAKRTRGGGAARAVHSRRVAHLGAARRVDAALPHALLQLCDGEVGYFLGRGDVLDFGHGGVRLAAFSLALPTIHSGPRG